MPSVNLTASYTLAAGGRVIEFPIGDLLNGAYATLNQLTASQRFPQLENQKILLAPNNFYDVKVRTTYPIFNKDIQHNQTKVDDWQDQRFYLAFSISYFQQSIIV